MRRDLTTSSASHKDTGKTRLARASWRFGDVALPNAARLLAAMAFGALMLALAYQIPVTHTVDIGGYDSAYVQGFYDPERGDQQHQLALDGSDGSARWTGATSYLIFPQAGLPAQLTLRLRGWRASGPAPNVTLLLNGTILLGQFRTGAEWEDHTFQINSGLLKPNDVVIQIQSETARLSADDPREVGVLIDRATFHAGPTPITPYPAQLLYGALAAGLLYLLVTGTSRQADKQTRNGPNLLLVSLSPRLLVWIGSVLILSLGF